MTSRKDPSGDIGLNKDSYSRKKSTNLEHRNSSVLNDKTQDYLYDASQVTKYLQEPDILMDQMEDSIPIPQILDLSSNVEQEEKLSIYDVEGKLILSETKIEKIRKSSKKDSAMITDNISPRESDNPKSSEPKVVKSDPTTDKDGNINVKALLWVIFKDGLTNSISGLFVKLTSFLLIFLSGQEKQSRVIVSALGTATVYGRFVSDIGFGYSSGLNVIAGRCYGVKDYLSLKEFLWMTHCCVNTQCVFLAIYLVVIYYLVGFIYAGQEQLIYYIRACVVLMLPSWYLYNNKSIMKQFYVGSQLYNTSLMIEISTVGFYLLSFWIGVKYFNFGSFGTIFASVVSAAISLQLYWSYYKFGKGFKKFRNGVVTQYLKVNGLKDMRTKGSVVVSLMSGEGGEKEIKNNEAKKKLLNWSNFIKFNSLFSFNTIFQSVWWQIDGFTTSVIFDEVQISAQMSLQSFARLQEFLSVGYCMSLSTKLSRLLMKGKVMEAKKASIFCCSIQLAFGVIEAVLGLIFSEQIARILISDPESQVYVNKNMKILAVFIPLLNLQGGIFGILRSIDGQKAFLYCQLVCNYGVHFGTMAIFFGVFKMDSSGLWYARLCSQTTLNIAGQLIIVLTDWEERTNQIKKSI